MTAADSEEDRLPIRRGRTGSPRAPWSSRGAAGGTLKPMAEMVGGVAATHAAFSSGSKYVKETIRVCDVTPLIPFS